MSDLTPAMIAELRTRMGVRRGDEKWVVWLGCNELSALLDAAQKSIKREVLLCGELGCEREADAFVYDKGPRCWTCARGKP